VALIFTAVGTNGRRQDLPAKHLTRHLFLYSSLCPAAQSSGKSSVIDALVGLDLLPRNTGLCTRCPLEIQLINVEKAVCEGVCGVSGGFWAEFGHSEQRVRFTNPDLIKQEILRQTERLCGINKGISANTPIGLAIYSDKVPDLVLVDLPGLVKTPSGDQPPDIERQIRECWSSYISQKDSIILAVTPATQDIFADDALKAALDVDPEGDRTIGE
jgi:Dynamin family